MPILGGIAAYLAAGKGLDSAAGSLLNALFNFTFGVLIEVVLGVLTFVLSLVTYFVTFLLELNFKILDPVGPAYNFISVGWTIMRDIANLGFVLFIIIIALATIVRFRDYEAKQLLPRLIGAAILVNFSLAIPSVFLNFSDVLSNYFLNKIGLEQNSQGNISGSAKFALALGNIANPTSVLLGGTVEDMVNDWAGEKTILRAVADVSRKMMGGTFLALAIFVIGALGVLFLVRFVYLHFLLVLAPIVWLFWIIPNLHGQFSNWWKKFLQYAFFLPISIFFLYLTIGVGKKLYIITQNANMDLFTAKGAGDAIRNVIQQVVAGYVVMAFLIGSIIAGKSLSIAGADSALKMGKNLVDKGKGWAKKGAKAGGDAAMRSTTAQGLAQRLQNSKYRPIRKLGDIASNRVYQKQLENEKKAKKQVTGRGREVDENIAQQYERGTGAQQAAALNILAPKMADLQKGREDAERSANSSKKNLENKEAILLNNDQDTENELTKLENGTNENGRRFAQYERNYRNANKELESLGEDASSEKRAELENVLKEAKKLRDAESKKTENKDLLKDWREKDAARLTAKGEYNTAKENEKKKNKELKSAQDAENQYKSYVIDKLPANVVQQLAAAQYKLENTNLPGSARAREGKLPDLSIEKLQKEFDKIHTAFEKTTKEYEAMEKNPFATQDDLARMKEKHAVAERVHNEKEAYLQLFKEVDEGWKKAITHEKEFIEQRTKEGLDKSSMKRHGDYKKIAKEKEKALRDYYAVISGNHPNLATKIIPGGAPVRSAAFSKKGKKDKDDDE